MLGIYCRTSKQREVKYTLENQKDAGIKCAKALGLQFRTYVDDGISGTLDDSVRGGLSDLFRDIRRKEITHVYCIDQSRIERESDTWRLFVSICLNFNVKYFPGGSEFNLDDPTNRMLANLMSTFNSYYAEITSKKVRSANAKKAIDGKTHGLKPYGYSRNENNEYEILPHEAKFVRLMFKLSLEGKGAYTIANILNEKGVPTKFSGNFKGQLKRKDKYTKDVKYFEKEKVLWRGNVISDILRNPIYKGTRVWNRHEDKIEYIDGKLIKKKVVAEVIHAKVPNIIEPDLFDKVQLNFEKNRKNVGRRDEYHYLLNGIVYCEKCGSEYRGKKRLKGNDNAYKCSGKRYPNTSCDNRGIGIPKLESFIIKYLFVHKEFRTHLLKMSKEKTDDDSLQLKLKKNEKDLAQTQKEINRAQELLLDPEYQDLDFIKNKLRDLRKKESSLKQAIQIIQDKIIIDDKSAIKKIFLNSIKKINPALSNDKLTADFESFKKVIHSLIDWISVKHNKLKKGGSFNIKIKFKNLNEYHMFQTDWQMNKWVFLDYVARLKDQSDEEMISEATKENFDVRKELKKFEHNLTLEEYKRKFANTKDANRYVTGTINLADDELYNFE